MAKIVRNMSTPEARKFWREAEENAREVATWPWWKRALVCEHSDTSYRPGCKLCDYQRRR